MRPTMWIRALGLTAVLSLVALADTALAGGVIIDGRGVDNMTTMMIDKDLPPDPPPADDNDTAQLLYLWMAAVYATDEATYLGDNLPVERTETNTPLADLTPVAIIDGVEIDGAGGCQAAPGSVVAALAALLLRRRRR